MKTDIIVSQLKKGDQLFSTRHGIVTFDHIRDLTPYSIIALDSDKNQVNFTVDGLYYESDNLSSLFKKSLLKEIERVILVRDSLTDRFKKRVLLTVKNSRAVCWFNSETIEDSKKETTTCSWKYWKELDKSEKIVHLTFQDISDGKGVGIDPKLIKITL